MLKTSLKSRILNREECFGVFCSIPSAVALEQMAAAGYDFVIIDLEHTLISCEQIETMVLAARASQLEVLVRVPPNTSHLVVPLLDAGVAGMVFARVDHTNQARNAVGLCHYAPLGHRGLNSTRTSRYGMDGLNDAIHKAMENTLVVVMIESLEGLSNVESIAKVDGIDVILEGAADLSQSMGLSWQTSHVKVQQALEQICAAAHSAGKAFCALPRHIDDMQRWRKQSVSLFVIGDDRGIMRRAHQAHLLAHKEIV
ncbi:aldolase [Marinomonas sp. UCMA 3892]|uniref:HpcH/HpaI aldolase family protein n=1 Tax=unclassified Marinomonas TaxID=196814 RepID=UPI000C1E69C8|nr:MULTISPECIES: aldolase/citrate lyase family protein [unclassified Marinomonas]NLU99021.1 aldolase [Marinomonas sp. UCMA 3892]PJE53605.1 aldolase [Marinomonas sp. BSi20584]